MNGWQCKGCKHYNANDEDFCDKCFAPRKASGAPRETCRTCLHRHSTGKLCHVYVVNKKRRRLKAEEWNKPRQSSGGGDNSGLDGEGFSTAGDSSGSSKSSDESDQDNDSTESGDEKGDDSNEDEEGSDEDEDEGSSDNSSDESESEDANDDQPKKNKGLIGLGGEIAAKAAAIAKTAETALQAITGGGKPQPHETPRWAKAACFKRCNCDHGVPTDNTAFVPLTDGRIVEHEAVGSVRVRTEPPVGEELEFENRPPLASMPPSPYALRLFLEYMDARTVAWCAHTSTEWHRECYEQDDKGKPVHPAYVGLHCMGVNSTLDACQDKIDALFFHQPPTGSNGQLFTSGQRSVTAWRRVEIQVSPHDKSESSARQGDGSQASSSSNGDAEANEPRTEVSWEAAGVAVRDTAPFTTIRPINSSVICCSSNGSIREWSLAHEVKNTRFLAQMWEHNGFVTDVAFSPPSVGYCKPHSAPAHSCYMYSVSDDRYLKVWDLSTKDCLHTVKPTVANCGTLQSVAISDFHLYTGTSNGGIVVFALGRVCQRPEKHRCHLFDEPRWFCEQETLEHGEEPVQHMVCGGVGGRYKYIFTASRDGSIKVWNVPKASFGHDEVCTFRQHTRAITALSVTKAHLFSASDEGHVRIWSLGTLRLQRVIRQEWRIKCIWVHHAPPESRDAGRGSLFIGLATGLVLTYPITDAV